MMPAHTSGRDLTKASQNDRRADDHEDVLKLRRGRGKAFNESDADTQDELHDEEFESHGQHIADGVDGVILEKGTAAESHQDQRRRHGDHGFALDEDHLGGNERETHDDNQRRDEQRDGVARRPDGELVQHQFDELHAGEER